MPDTSSRVSALKVRGSLPPAYAATLSALKERIHAGRVRAALAVNREVIDLYWVIGKTITERQQAEGWGNSVVERLAADLRDAFPDMKGFSPANIWRMRAFYLAWPVLGGEGPILAQGVRELPWGHNVDLVQKVKVPEKRLWYAQMARKHGWARSTLAMQIETDLHGRQGKAVSNFTATLPSMDSDLAAQAMKDPYNFDFLGLAQDAHERDIENALLSHIKRFLLEPGEGFAFVGQQYKVTIGESDFYKAIPEDLKGSLPTIEEIEDEFMRRT